MKQRLANARKALKALDELLLAIDETIRDFERTTANLHEQVRRRTREEAAWDYGSPL